MALEKQRYVAGQKRPGIVQARRHCWWESLYGFGWPHSVEGICRAITEIWHTWTVQSWRYFGRRRCFWSGFNPQTRNCNCRGRFILARVYKRTVCKSPRQIEGKRLESGRVHFKQLHEEVVPAEAVMASTQGFGVTEGLNVLTINFINYNWIN